MATCLELVVFFAVMTTLSTGAAAALDSRILSSSTSSISFEIDVPVATIISLDDGSVRVDLSGYGSFSPPGAFEAPGRTFHVAIPVKGNTRVDYRVLEQDDLGSLYLSRAKMGRFVRRGKDIPHSEYFIPEDPWKGQIRADIVEAKNPSMMGRQRVLPVRINPLIMSGERIILARKILVTVYLDSSKNPSDENTARSAPVSGRWKKIYDDILVNPDDVARFSRPPASVKFTGSAAAAGKHLKIKIPETGIYSIRADSLIASGLSPFLSNTEFALKKLYYDISEPGLVREVISPTRIIKGTGSAPGIFEGDDRLVFYAKGIKDDDEAGDVFATFTDYNIIWLEEGVAGGIMDEASLPTGSGMAVPDFDAVYKGRKDTYYHKNISAGSWDFYFVQGPVETEAVIPFVINDPAVSNFFSLTLRVLGWGDLHKFMDVSIRNSSGTHFVGTDEVIGSGSAEFRFTGIESGFLVDGVNELLVSSSTSWGFLINDFEIEYPAGFSLHDDMLEFSLSAMIPVQDIEVTGFSTPDGYLIDISDGAAPLFSVLPAEDFHPDGSTYTLSLKIPEEGGQYVVLGKGAGGHVFNDWISVDFPSGIIGQAGPYDALVISHHDFLPPAITDLTEYAAWREEQGYRLFTVDVDDVYDEFNGGLKSCEAIRRFIQYGHDNWGVDFVLLVGDGNEDHKQIFYDESSFKGSPPDYIPPFSYSVDVVGSDYDDEVITTDKYYTFLDETFPSSGYPDVFVGRLPVGRELELRALLIKMKRFENPSLDESWRRRTVLFADDAWSGYPGYRYRSSELHFEQGMERIAQDIEISLPGGFDIQRLFLSRWTEGAHEIGESGPTVFKEATDSTRTYFTPYILDRLNEGCLIFSFQGHAHRAHLTTESGFSMFSQYKDIDKLTSDRNFVFFGAGCHISQFAIVMELSRSAVDGPNGDCISEQMLFKSRSGAVAAYASAGFELLDQNEYFFDKLHQVMFRYPPVDSVPPLMQETGAHWILGEIITKAEIEHTATTYYGYDQTFRYFILGDPMTRVDPGPPAMKLEAGWDGSWQELVSDSLRSQNSSNRCTLRFTANDVIALGDITLTIGGEDRTTDLDITRLGDEAMTRSRGYSAEIEYTIGLDDGSLIFSVYTPGGREAGRKELVVETVLRLFFNDDLEIAQGGQSPADGVFRFTADFPVFLAEAPLLFLDGVELSGTLMNVPAGYDSTHWETSFPGRFAAGSHDLSVHVSDYSREFVFEVSGDGLITEVFNFPNPFSSGTNICFSLNLPADSGKIMIYNVSGRLIKTITIPADMLRASGNILEPNFVWWDGRDLAGNMVANGTYILLLRIEKDGKRIDTGNTIVKLE